MNISLFINDKDQSQRLQQRLKELGIIDINKQGSLSTTLSYLSKNVYKANLLITDMPNDPLRIQETFSQIQHTSIIFINDSKNESYLFFPTTQFLKFFDINNSNELLIILLKAQQLMEKSFFQSRINDRIFVNLTNKDKCLRINDIIYAEANGNHTNLFIRNASITKGDQFELSSIQASRTLKSFLEQIAYSKQFIRINKSTAVNSSYIIERIHWLNKQEQSSNYKYIRLEGIETLFKVSDKFCPRLNLILNKV